VKEVKKISEGKPSAVSKVRRESARAEEISREASHASISTSARQRAKGLLSPSGLSEEQREAVPWAKVEPRRKTYGVNNVQEEPPSVLVFENPVLLARSTNFI